MRGLGLFHWSFVQHIQEDVSLRQIAIYIFEADSKYFRIFIFEADSKYIFEADSKYFRSVSIFEADSKYFTCYLQVKYYL